MMKAMRADGPDQGTGCRQAARQAPAGSIRDRMVEDVDRWLGSPHGRGGCDRRNGTYRCRLLREPGDMEPGCCGPAAPPPCPAAVRAAPGDRDRVILAGFVFGPSTRRIGEVLPPLLGRPIPPATVGRVAGILDAAVAAFHRRPLTNRCKALMPTVWCRRTGPVPELSGVPYWLPSASSPTGARGSSTSNPPGARKRRRMGAPARLPSTGAAPPARSSK